MKEVCRLKYCLIYLSVYIIENISENLETRQIANQSYYSIYCICSANLLFINFCSITSNKNTRCGLQEILCKDFRHSNDLVKRLLYKQEMPSNVVL